MHYVIPNREKIKVKAKNSVIYALYA